LVGRYLPAVYRYLLAIVRNSDIADELCQQFAVKFLEGGFRGASPERGRFRNYIKTTVINLVRTHYRQAQKSPSPLPENVAAEKWDLDEQEQETTFVREWQKEVLELTWDALKNDRLNYYRVLRLRIELPEASSRELAESYRDRYKESMTPANVRKIQERAHSKFARLLIDEVASSLDEPTPETVRAELSDLDLLKYCKTAFEDWSARRS
jgi:RNA polymerase sigma-70 factor (ECF subfamily)